VRIAHRKNVLFRDRAIWDTVVNACSGFGGYCHSELIFDNGLSFTSTSRFDPATAVYPSAHFCVATGRHSGPVIRRIDFPSSLYDFTPVEVTDSQKLQVYRWCEQTIDQSIKDNAGYDWAGVNRFMFKFLPQHKEDWFCSESVVAALQTVGYFRNLKAWTISPNKLWKLCA
jgi:hypothetical protein